MYNVCLLPSTYEIPLIKVQNNLRKHKKHESLFLIKYKQFWET